jgi:hypothetical protein
VRLFFDRCSFFRDCSHPDGKQRAALAKKLGLRPIQVKFWFQNRRTHLKVSKQPTLSSTLYLVRFALLACWCMRARAS